MSPINTLRTFSYHAMLPYLLTIRLASQPKRIENQYDCMIGFTLAAQEGPHKSE